jgi:DNA (cytosine-5)-methyltransferase 1
MAALSGNILPELPQPTHDFKSFSGSLTIKLPSGPVQPINTSRGTALYPRVTIKDAIDDLEPFSWFVLIFLLPAFPYIKHRAHPDMSRLAADEFLCDVEDDFCGPKGPGHYQCPPRNTFQKRCRSKEDQVIDLQHWTRTFQPAVVMR